MNNYKIEINLSIDFEKHFKHKPNDINTVLNDEFELMELNAFFNHIVQMTNLNHMDWIAKSPVLYEKIKFHLLIKEDIANQFLNNSKITLIK